MVVKTAIVSALAFHILLNAFEVPLFFFELPIEQFQFASGPFDSVPAPIHPDLPALRQRKLRFAEAEWFGKRVTLHFFLFTRIPIDSNRRTISCPIRLASSMVGKTRR